MSGLRERLLRHTRSTGSTPLSEKISEPDGFAGAHEDSAREGVLPAPALAPPSSPEAAAPLPAAWRIIGAELQTNEHGSFICRRRAVPLSAAHGKYTLAELHPLAPSLGALLPSHTAAVSADSLLFLDTETTGLGVGAGNVPFMIGIGYYEGESFVVEQLFIRNMAEEFAMLHYLQMKLLRYPQLVTYNGRSFDWPLIQSRYVLNRMHRMLPDVAHIDFLHPSRSIWKNTLPSCKLSQVEEDRLQVHRIGDVPGSLAPALYMQYLTEGNPTLLHGIFKHNEIDILTLAALGIHFAKLLGGDLSFVEMKTEERFRSALWLDRMERHELAQSIMEQLSEELLFGYASTVWNTDLPLRMASWYKKRMEHQRAAALWHGWIDCRDGVLQATTEPYVELAIHYEHRDRDFAQALRHAEAALDILRRRRKLSRAVGSDQTEDQELAHRIQRLKKKLTGV